MHEGGPSRRRVSGLRHQRAATTAGHQAQGGEAGGHQGVGGRLGDGGDGRFDGDEHIAGEYCQSLAASLEVPLIFKPAIGKIGI